MRDAEEERGTSLTMFYQLLSMGKDLDRSGAQSQTAEFGICTRSPIAL